MRSQRKRILVTITAFSLVAIGGAWAASPVIGIERSGDAIVVRFSGTLQNAGDAGGPFISVPGATSPYRVATGDGNRRFWRAVAPEISNELLLTAGGNHTLALSPDGILRAWGANLTGQLGLGLFTSVPPYGLNAPQVVIGGATWRQVVAGRDHTMAIREDGTLWGWGFNGYGQLGDGTETGTSQAQLIGAGRTWQAVAAGGHHTVAVQAGGTLWSWGDNRDGQVGNGTVNYLDPFTPWHGIASPVQLGTNADWRTVAAGPTHTLALRQDGSLWAWGANSSGQVGNGAASLRVVRPQPVAGSARWQAVSAGIYHTVGLRLDGTLWAWGGSGDGQAGLGTNTSATSPQLIGGEARWLAVSAGAFHTVALRSDGTLWGCGRNDLGQLGPIGTNRVNTLQPIETNLLWTAVVAGERHTVAVRADRSAWSWGDNASGQLGNGSFTGSNEPQRIAGSETW